MNTPNETTIARTIAPEDAWRYDDQERMLMIEQGYVFETRSCDRHEQPSVHDGVWSPESIVAHCRNVRREIAERSQTIIDIPV